MAWVDVNERMPDLGVEVFVAGRYIPVGYGNPRARRRNVFGSVIWTSTEWRATCAITHWWEQDNDES